MIRNGNNTSVTSQDLISDVLDIIDSPITVANSFTQGDLLYLNSTGTWTEALNNNVTTLATHVVKEASATEFLLAKPNELVTRLGATYNPGDPVHSSPTVLGGSVTVASGSGMPPGAAASNVVGYATTPTQFIVKQTTAYLT